MKKIFDKIKYNSVYLKLLKFFHQNPGCVDTAKNISHWIEEEEEKKVIQGLKFLEIHGFLIRHKSETTEGYGYTQDEKLMKRVERFLNEIEKGSS